MGISPLAHRRLHRLPLRLLLRTAVKSWAAGSTQTITWTYTGNRGSAVQIDLYKAGALNSTIIASTGIGAGGIGSYSWTIPGALTPAG